MSTRFSTKNGKSFSSFGTWVIAKDITNYRAQASSIFSKVETMFNDNNLKLPKTTNIEVRGQNKRKEYFILALFSSISEAKTFEHQGAEGRRKNVTKIGTARR